jgi:hypothetical protein
MKAKPSLGQREPSVAAGSLRPHLWQMSCGVVVARIPSGFGWIFRMLAGGVGAVH